MPKEKLQVAIAGFSNTGKSTIAKMIAEQLDATFVSAGIFYRGMTKYFLDKGITELTDEEIEEIPSIIMQLDPEDTKNIWVNGKHYKDSEIRQSNVTKKTGQFCVNEKFLLAVWPVVVRTVEAIDRVVMDGRNAGSEILTEPDVVKLFFTAELETRIKRLVAEQLKKKEKIETEEIEKIRIEMVRNDTAEQTRKINPLKQPEDAHVIDTTHLNIPEVFDAVMHIIKEASTSSRVSV